MGDLNELELIKKDVALLKNRLESIENSIYSKSEINELNIELNNLIKRVEILENKNNYHVNNNIEMYDNRRNLPPVTINQNYNSSNNNISKLPLKEIKKDKSLENGVGTKVMSVLAAILIFIGVGSLGALAIANMSEICKFISLEIIGMIITYVGLKLLNKKANTFTYSISAIGIGWLYICTILGVTSKTISDVWFIVIIAVLIVFNQYISNKYNSLGFQIITLIGFTIAIQISYTYLSNMNYYVRNINENIINFIKHKYTYTIEVMLFIIYFIGIAIRSKKHTFTGGKKIALDILLMLSNLYLIACLQNVYVDNFTYGVDFTDFLVNILFALCTIHYVKTYNRLSIYYKDNDIKYKNICYFYIIVYFTYISICGTLAIDLIATFNILMNIEKLVLILISVLFVIMINTNQRNESINVKWISYFIIVLAGLLCDFDLIVLNDIEGLMDHFGSLFGILDSLFIGLIVIGILMHTLLKVGEITEQREFNRYALLFFSASSITLYISKIFYTGIFYPEKYAYKNVGFIGLFLFTIGTLIISEALLKILKGFIGEYNEIDKVLYIIFTAYFYWNSLLYIGTKFGSTRSDLKLFMEDGFQCDILRYYIIAIIPILILMYFFSNYGYSTKFSNKQELLSKSKIKTFNIINICCEIVNDFIVLFYIGVILGNAVDNTYYNLMPKCERIVDTNKLGNILEAFYITLIVLVVVSFVIMTFKNLYYTKIAGYLIGIKTIVVLTLLINVLIRDSNSDIGYIYSVIYLIIAIVNIIIGFKIDNESFRIFGLMVSIISVLKLVFVDMIYVNTIVRILAYIVSGLLCLGIVWIYNRMTEDKKKKVNLDGGGDHE